MSMSQPTLAQCGVGVACEGCGRRLPLCRIAPSDEALLWECVDCHTHICGDISPEIMRMLSRRIRLAALHFNVEQAAPLTDALLQVVWRNPYLSQRCAYHEGRRSGRIKGQREVIARRLDQRYQLAGPAINGVVANLSRHGQMLVTTTQINSSAVITQFQNASRTIQLIGRIVWSRYLDVGCYGAGVAFIARFGRSDG